MSINSGRRNGMILIAAMLSACVNHEARQLVPSLTLSPEVVTLSGEDSRSSPSQGVNFGFVTTINESDSLTNITVLPGVRVRSVTPGGAAALAGVRAGDVILSIDGRETNHPDLTDAIAMETAAAQTFQFEVRRNTTVFEATVNARPIMDERVAPVELYRADPIATRAGFSTALLENADQQPLSGAQIVEIFKNSPLPEYGFAVGDILLAINGQPVESAQGFINSVHNDHALGDTITVSTARDGRLTDRRLTLWDPGRRISKISLWPLLTYESTLSPERARLAIVDLLLFSLFSYQRVDGEKEVQLFSLFRFATGYGELQEEE